MLPSNIGLAGLILWAGLSSVLATDALIPPPLGPYSTLITTTMLTDVTRLDPFAPTNTSRALMVSVYSPIPSSQCSNLSSTEYMPDKTANFYDQTYGPLGIPAGTFESLKLQVCTQIHRKYRPRQYPIVLFSPGLGNSRLEYGAIAQSVASNGYIVISIDHTYDASIVEFPDGSVILGADIETEEQITFALAVRAQDVTFVLNQLRIPSFSRSFFLDSSCQLNIKNVGIFGHSLGGATALASMANDTRLSGGVNLDGTFFGPAIQQGTKRPFLLVGHEGKNQSTDPSWGATWPELKAWKLELEVLGTQHGSFTDLPLLVDVLGLAPYLPPAVIELLGSITGPRSLEIMRVFVGAFFDKVLRGKGSEILRKATPAYPEVVFIAKSN
ncbi:PAF acetylhydrolase family protein [Hyaloscypha hepaticicola]|uniref:1-alkyl-2-acetylglycerophosphocholine esterase n=1 Tax=Hyaloscypha hepaticicola TaxID=2082293 RepID=A0A2J6Q1N6_9HELO|nr:PAF acetylhydrolase family protein [Hyaloscypha hepaticicola]